MNPCSRCEAPEAPHWWNVCALPGTQYLCDSCDILVNDSFLRILEVQDRSRLMSNYRRKVKRETERRRRMEVAA